MPYYKNMCHFLAHIYVLEVFMKAYIFDLDGTLIDSYNGILESIMNVLDFYNINIKREDAYSYIIENSVHEFLNDLSKKYNISLNDVKEKYSIYLKEFDLYD